jgi:hypothetical protein
MIIYENESVVVKFDSSVPCVIWTPLEFMKGDDWRIPFTKGVDFLQQKIKTCPEITWLNDTRKLKTVSIEDLKWLNPNVNDRCFQYGLHKVAFVLPENIFGKMAVKFYVEFTNMRSDNKFQIKAFGKYEDAEKWLKSNVDAEVKEVSLT